MVWRVKEQKAKKISFKEACEIEECFSSFVSFLNGRRCGSLLKKGICNNQEKEVWADYSNYIRDQFKPGITSWTADDGDYMEQLNRAWKNFSNLWKKKEDKQFLQIAIHWYVEANSQSGFVEGGIIMAQTCLELIYNWLLIENKKLLIGQDANNINASNKIRLLLSHIQLGSDIPHAFNDLKKMDNGIDAPEAFVQIRNAIAHSQEKHRKKLSEMPEGALVDALELVIWYIELLLLYILEYNGLYFNCTMSGGYQKVPWVN